MLTKEYLGEVALPLENWFVAGKERSFLFGQSDNKVSILIILPLISF